MHFLDGYCVYDVDACVANQIARWQDYLEMIMTSTDLNLMVFLTKIMQNIVSLYTEWYELYYMLYVYT